jgi:RNA:NAD 2'-phosphotransferase (TPT1/KptA family)/GNAT superfamily N-acetyltransferase/ADP-ribose pyrophosphatase YjhB (NUDIX family)
MRWYHGTSRQNAKKALKEGILKPGEDSIYDVDVPRDDAVYITSEYQIAKYYAEEHSWQGKGGVVLEVAANEGSLMPDEDAIYDALHEGAVVLGEKSSKKLGQAIRKAWLRHWKSIEGEGDTFEEAWEAWGNVEAEGSSGIAEEMKELTEEIHRENPALSKAIIEASGKAAHIGPVKVMGIAKKQTAKPDLSNDQEPLEAARQMLAELGGNEKLCGKSKVVHGYWIETHTLGCRNAADEPESEWEANHKRIRDEYANDGVSIVLDDKNSSNFATVTPQSKTAAKKVRVVKTPGFMIEVPQERRKTFFIRPKTPLEYWAFKNRPRVFVNEPLIFTFGGKPVAEAVAVRVEAPGRGEGEYRHWHKVYWKPTSFKRFRITASERPGVLYHISRRTNRQSILKNGLLPLLKEYKDVERAPGIYFFQSIDAAKDYGFYHAQHVNQALDIWECRIPEGYEVRHDPHPEMDEFDAWMSHEPLPPENLKVVDTILVPKSTADAPPPYKSQRGDKFKRMYEERVREFAYRGKGAAGKPVPWKSDLLRWDRLTAWEDRNTANDDAEYTSEEIEEKYRLAPPSETRRGVNAALLKSAKANFPTFEQVIDKKTDTNNEFEIDMWKGEELGNRRKEYDELLRQMKALKFPLTVYRCFALKEGEKIDYSSLGGSWSLNSRAAYLVSHELFPDDEGYDYKTVAGTIQSPDAVDWLNTMRAWLTLPDEEEIRLKPGAKVGVRGKTRTATGKKFYHGTKKKNLDDILKNGLKVEMSEAHTEWGRAIYLACDAYTAANYEGMHGGGEPWAILEIDGSKLNEYYMRPDDYDFPDLWEQAGRKENWAHQTWQTSLKVSCQIAYLADIPASAIKVHPYKKNNVPAKNTQKEFLDSHTVEQVAEHFGITPAAAAKAKSEGIVKKADMTEDPDYYMTEGCGIWAVDFARKNGGEIYILSAERGEEWSEEIPYEVTHAFVKKDGRTYDVRGERTPDKMAWELSMGEYTVKGPWTPDEFEAKFMGSTDDKPLFGKESAKTATMPPRGRFMWHVTPMRNVPSIKKNGLIPQVGERSAEGGEKPGIFLFPTKQGVEDALTGWLGESFENTPEELAIVEVAVPEDVQMEDSTDYTTQFEVVIRQPLPANYIRRIYTEKEFEDHLARIASKTADKVIGVGEGDEYWAGEGNAASGVLPVCPSKGTVCLAWRSPYVMSPDCWGTIGGAVKKGMSPQQSAKTEMAEETGYHGGIRLIPAYTFLDRGFKYFNFVGVVPNEFPFSPGEGHGWETDHIAWVPYEQVVKDMQENPGDYHPGLLKLFANSKDAIERALKIKKQGAIKTASIDTNGWITPDGDWEPLEDGETHVNAIQRLLNRDDVFEKDGLKEGYIRVHYQDYVPGQPIEAYFLCEKRTSHNFALVREAIHDLPSQTKQVAVVFKHPEDYQTYTFEEALEDFPRRAVFAAEKQSAIVRRGAFDPLWMKRWVEGGCWLFALALQPLIPGSVFVGLAREGEVLEHVGVRKGDRYYDVRGEMDETEFNYGADSEVPLHIVPVDYEQVMRDGEYGSWLGHEDEFETLPEMQAAKEAVQKVFGKGKTAEVNPTAPPPSSSRLPCPSGKRKFYDEVSAIGPHKQWSKGTPNLRAYKCPICGWWHLTSKPQRVTANLHGMGTFYHGTSWAEADQIKVEGLKAHPWAFNDKSYVWCTLIEQLGISYGESKTENSSEPGYVVSFEWDYDQTEPDPEHGEEYEDVYRRIEGDVPASAITGINYYAPDHRLVKTAAGQKQADAALNDFLAGRISKEEYKAMLSGESQPEQAPQQQHLFPSSQDAKFKAWFDGSKVVDKNGNPMPVYHGTRSSVEFEEFSVEGPPQTDSYENETTSSGSGADPTAFLGAHFAEETNVANLFAEGKGWTGVRYEGEQPKPRVIQVFLRITNPKDFGSEHNLREFINQGKIADDEVTNLVMENRDGINYWEPEQEQAAQEWGEKYENDQAFRTEVNRYLWEQHSTGSEYEGEQDRLNSAAYDLAMQARNRLTTAGYDGVRYKNVVEGGHAWIAFAANQIKSVYSQFNPKDPSFTASKDAATHTPEYAQKLVEALKQTVTDADFRVIGSVGAGQESENDIDIMVDIRPDAAFKDDQAWIDTSGLTGAMKLLGFDYLGPSDFAPGESAEKSEASGKYLDPAGSGVEKFFNPTTYHTVEFWFTESGMPKEADWRSKYVLPTALALGLGAPSSVHPDEVTPQQIEQVREEQAKKRIDALVEAISRAEGAKPELNNPGNLVDFNTGKIRTFDSWEEGRNALAEQLERIADGDHPNIKPDMTLREAGLVYSNGDPNWAKNVSRIMRVPETIKMQELVRGRTEEAGVAATPSGKIGWLRKAAGFAFKSFKKLWHVGSMNPKDKRPGSLEGVGLSVSVHPEEWKGIAEIGGPTWELTKPGNKFLNFYRLSKTQRKQIAVWGVANGYATEVAIGWRWYFTDAETDEERYMEFETEQEAQEEMEGQGIGEVRPAKGSSMKGTEKLKQRTKNPKADDMVVAFDLLVTVYAEDELDCDGVWWEDIFDPASLSAPRGVIFPGKLSSWKKKKVEEVDDEGAAPINREIDMLEQEIKKHGDPTGMLTDHLKMLKQKKSGAAKTAARLAAYDPARAAQFSVRVIKHPTNPNMFDVRAVDVGKGWAGTVSVTQKGKDFYVTQSVLYKPYQGIGLGSRLYAWAMDEAEKRGGERFWSDVEVSLDAQKIWERLDAGFDEESGRFFIPLMATVKTATAEFFRDSNGVLWAKDPALSPNPVSIPNRIPEGEREAYVAEKLRQQGEMDAALKTERAKKNPAKKNPWQEWNHGLGTVDPTEVVKKLEAEGKEVKVRLIPLGYYKIWFRDKTAAKPKPSPTQVAALQGMAAGDGTIHREKGGFWIWGDYIVGWDSLGLPIFKGEEEGRHLEPRPWVDIRTVRAMESRGWVKRTNKFPEEWRDNRKITDAGRALIAGKTADLDEDDDIYDQPVEYFAHSACWLYAFALHKLTGLPMVSISDPHEGVIHAAVEREGKLLDSKGEFTLKQIGKRYGLKNPFTLPLTEEGVEYFYGINEHELERAMEVAREQVKKLGIKTAAAEIYLYHGTSEDNWNAIMEAGGVVPAGSCWGTERVAEYYAEDRAEAQTNDAIYNELGTRVEEAIIRVPLSRFDETNLKPDGNSVAEPLTFTLQRSEEDLYADWQKAGGTWQDSLRIYESVRYDAPMKVTKKDRYV